ncbi:ATP-dependent Lon protease [Vibrio gazogenes]|uniref:ATP-dependent Lon protease n=1 Tax=Vibrio gazogenes DSM 21264 = NBRC 103151 TaxID=1123492 RepID=A0A1M5FSW6_VIBGA|nr:ATP-dependent Lon protease [Vibrio gazogenes]USP13556.1 ATP-dependent Lon protease [Vibrio gazogenes]SHF94291.1 hypothetical protein SAMN02745781_03558 [Vibrio gazogenes DSM 21264] [Vibrio gazogenes DSM 21264 = NBRC 103151]SJN54828.1 hypothetical protein BQ6471_01227 [Vibrio gazogenes]
MIVSPNNISVPLIAPSVNVPTEQAEHDNRVRAPVVPTVQLEKTNAERRLKSDDKQRKRASWDAADHPQYEIDSEQEQEIASSYEEETPSELERLFKLLALSTYSKDQGKGYTIRFRLPKHIIDAAITEGQMARRRTVIKYHYGHAIAPNTPSEVIAIL